MGHGMDSGMVRQDTIPAHPALMRGPCRLPILGLPRGAHLPTIGRTSDVHPMSFKETTVPSKRLRPSGIRCGIAAGFLLLVLPSSGLAQGPDQELISRVDALNAAGSYQEAVALMNRALDRNGSEHALQWRMAESLTNWARKSPEDEIEPRYGEAVTWARRAVQTDDTDAQAWFHLGKALGRLALFKGGKAKVNMSKEVKEDFEKALELKPDHALALHGLARWNREVANLSWILKTAAKIIYGGLPPASNEQAVTLFKKAIALEPDNIAHHLELGKTYLEMKQKADAAAEFDECLRLPATRPDDPEWKEEAEQLLSKIRK